MRSPAETGEDEIRQYLLHMAEEKKIVRTIKERCRTERRYGDLKGELGLDHFEGRSFRGWHHHFSVVVGCYAFVVAERVRAFPPSARRRGPNDAGFLDAAGALLGWGGQPPNGRGIRHVPAHFADA